MVRNEGTPATLPGTQIESNRTKHLVKWKMNISDSNFHSGCAEGAESGLGPAASTARKLDNVSETTFFQNLNKRLQDCSP